MRIAIVTESFLPSINGVTNSVIQAQKSLQSFGHETLFIAPEALGTPREFEGSRVIGLPAINVKKSLSVAFPSAIIDRILRDFAPDIVHLASPAIMGAFAQRVAQRRGFPTVAVYQTDYVGFSDHYRLSFAKSAINQLMRNIHGNAQLNLAPSKFATDTLASLGITNVARWGRGVDLELFHPSKRKSDLYPSHKRVIGFVGRLAPEKGIHRLQQLDSRPDIQLVIIGEGPELASLKQQLPHAIFTGKKSGDELAQHYASLDCFVHTGEHETFCQAAQEALASGIPVIAPTKGAVKEFVLDGLNGITVDMSDPFGLSAITEETWQFLTHADTRISARNSVQDRSWANINRELETHYFRVVDSHLEALGKRAS
jgi:phosphatidylinositol alpha 1,6-mannosyltransferase